jgi:hypothetical protein
VSASRTNRGSSWSSTGHPWRIAARAAPTHKRGPARATATGVRTTAQTISLLSLLQQDAGNLSDYTGSEGRANPGSENINTHKLVRNSPRSQCTTMTGCTKAAVAQRHYGRAAQRAHRRDDYFRPFS